MTGRRHFDSLALKHADAALNAIKSPAAVSTRLPPLSRALDTLPSHTLLTPFCPPNVSLVHPAALLLRFLNSLRRNQPGIFRASLVQRRLDAPPTPIQTIVMCALLTPSRSRHNRKTGSSRWNAQYCINFDLILISIKFNFSFFCDATGRDSREASNTRPAFANPSSSRWEHASLRLGFNDITFPVLPGNGHESREKFRISTYLLETNTTFECTSQIDMLTVSNSCIMPANFFCVDPHLISFTEMPTF
ncbi:hypothetical protein R3P38DRAFT_2803610 [Favolaschia claudopus]|uniref:Uncharacterized protein n=1 Tax=Favolaschia claudopus TaxID=2862362 RepID=A0AAV9ZT76_9AGAR